MKPRSFSYKEGNFLITGTHYEKICEYIITLRIRLESFIQSVPGFPDALEPLPRHALPVARLIPPIAASMIGASEKTGVGPMAAVAGAFAQAAGEKGLELGDNFVVINNGGDIFAGGTQPVKIGIYAPGSPMSGTCAFDVAPDMLPLGICSSSSVMGHSLSLGCCDLATAFAPDAALADAAATLACNLVRSKNDLGPVAERIAGIEGIRGIFLIKSGSIAMAGQVPPIIETRDTALETKITRDVFA